MKPPLDRRAEPYFVQIPDWFPRLSLTSKLLVWNRWSALNTVLPTERQNVLWLREEAIRPGVMVHAMALEASGRWWQEDQKFKGSLGQISSLRPTCLKTKTKQKKCSHKIPTLALASQTLLNPKYATHVKYWQAIFVCYNNRHKWWMTDLPKLSFLWSWLQLLCLGLEISDLFFHIFN